MPGDIAISGVRILLIDDDPEFCSLLNDYLELNSISLTCAHDGQSGLDILDRRAFDLILLDMFLPDINGLGRAAPHPEDAVPARGHALGAQ